MANEAQIKSVVRVNIQSDWNMSVVVCMVACMSGQDVVAGSCWPACSVRLARFTSTTVGHDGRETMYKHIFASSPWRFHQSPPPTKLFGSSRSVSCQESLRRHACRTIPFQGLAVQRGVLPLCGIHPNRYPAGLTPRQHISLLSPTAPRLLLAAPSAGAGQASTMQRARPYPFNVITASLRVTMTIP
ncbi:predicted protein [Plenodomus lingam JN3]|uniref:Predicted protein n=1 Tax=Leptosphaeria maculans (strain JN3 / isolate v23.1.3 / race Av1-4-5-6-7-8) TaxID=985895 RepID=E5A962_LEPMJ|nr:predicted protein [Plenodomus lingam JN3]CBY00203.1 predicted protein [Plenodomus lingam JN3]